MEKPRLRDSSRRHVIEPFCLNVIPAEVVRRIGGHFVYLLYTGRKDVSGNDWGDALADAVGGRHLGSPLGIADVVYDKMAWSAKTVKSNNPFGQKSVRLISGRCSPDYSYGITDPHADVQRTGIAVLNIWNERVNIAREYYPSLRTSILIRSADLLSYVLFEEESYRYRVSDYVWEVNSNGNFVGKSVETGEVKFTWQPHGSQFTIHEKIPESAVKFCIKKPPVMSKNEILENLEFDDSWVDIVQG